MSTHSLNTGTADGHAFAKPLNASRAPCPALNALANHGYISRDGRNLSFFELLAAVSYVYNLSFPLALLLTSVGFITCGTIRFGPDPKTESIDSIYAEQHPSDATSSSDIFSLLTSYLPRITLDLGSLCERGFFKISHNASMAHSKDTECGSPHAGLVSLFITTACKNRHNSASLLSISRFHAARLKAQPIGTIHELIAQGECALTLLALRGTSGDPNYTTPKRHRPSSIRESTEIDEINALVKGVGAQGCVPAERLEQWFGEERLPDGWWPQNGKPGVRAVRTIGLIQAAKVASVAGQITERAMKAQTKKAESMETPTGRHPKSSRVV